MLTSLGLLALLLLWPLTTTSLLQSSPTATSRLPSTALLATFSELSSNKIPQWLLDNCERLGFKGPTLVQQEALPTIFAGNDVVLQAQTGSGKTLAYGLPVLSSIDATRAAIQAVIVVPTRELGLQVAAVLKQLSSGSPKRIMIMPLMEGSKNRRQQLWATAEPPHIIVGNPKALQRLVDMGRLRLNSVSFVVLDEVDACLLVDETREDLHKLLSQKLSNSYQSADMEDLLDDVAAGGMQESLVYTDLAKDHRDIASQQQQYRSSRQTILCSATIPQRQHFATACFKNGWTETMPALIHVSAAELVPFQVEHEHIECSSEMRLAVLRHVIAKAAKVKVREATAGIAGDGGKVEEGELLDQQFRAIVFVDDGDDLETVKSVCESALKKAQVVGAVSILNEGASLDQRASSLGGFREGESCVLLCSGLAARGIDIPDITHVVMLSLPDSVNEYVHRAGRAGRYGRLGNVVTLSSPGQGFVLARYSNELSIPIKKRTVKMSPIEGGGGREAQDGGASEDPRKSTSDRTDGARGKLLRRKI